MKFSKVLSTTLALCITTITLVSCDSKSATTSQSQQKTCDHSWNVATCEAPKICSKCSATEGDALGHSWESATCESPKTCSRCSATEGDALGHSWESATCKTPKTCTVCLATEGSVLSEHNYKNGQCIYCNKKDPKESEFKSANDAYDYLTETHELCVDVMDSIYGAWYFAIYEADDYSSTQSCFNAFCSEAKLDYNDALKALNEVLQSMGYSDPTGIQQLAGLRTFSVTVAVVQRVYKNNGVYDQMDSNLSKAKTSLKTVTNSYSDYTGYPTLKSYYSEASAYAEFCKSPTGSFGQLKSTIDTYETNLRNYKNDLSFIFD